MIRSFFEAIAVIAMGVGVGTVYYHQPDFWMILPVFAFTGGPVMLLAFLALWGGIAGYHRRVAARRWAAQQARRDGDIRRIRELMEDNHA